MKFRTEKYIVNEEGDRFGVGDTVTIKHLDGGGCGSSVITKITDTGFRFTQDGKKEKSVQYKDLAKIEMQHSKYRRSTGRHDKQGHEVKEGDIIAISVSADKFLAENFVIKYGTWQAYCPIDKEYMDTIGFYVSRKDYPDMPLGPLEDYANVIGNIFDTPELLQEEDVTDD